MKRLWRDYSLTIVLVALFLAAWLGQFVSQVFEIREAAADTPPATMHQPCQRKPTAG